MCQEPCWSNYRSEIWWSLQPSKTGINFFHFINQERSSEKRSFPDCEGSWMPGLGLRFHQRTMWEELNMGMTRSNPGVKKSSWLLEDCGLDRENLRSWKKGKAMCNNHRSFKYFQSTVKSLLLLEFHKNPLQQGRGHYYWHNYYPLAICK